ncbi:MAG TPA: adenylosuccinate lyase [Candidatus Norongarragalinales archaeon]|nr:adenylosuccinate lyase [Candidatus Norongarragalinales archaeon]
MGEGENFESPFSWRYGSIRMRHAFSERQTRLNWRKIWVALAYSQNKLGLVSKEELNGITAQSKNVDIAKSLEIERQTKHDLVAELNVYSSQCKTGGGKIHLGATSMDIVDNAEVLAVREGLEILSEKTALLLKALKRKIEENRNTVCIGYTHFQPAEPTTLGYRFASYAQDLLEDLGGLEWVKENLMGKGFKGAVGTSAAYVQLLGSEEKARQMEEIAMKQLGLEAYEITTQTYPRKQDYLVLAKLSSLAQSIHKMAFDLRLMQNKETNEPFSEKQVGSSAMPFKRNPMKTERICSLARLIPSYAHLAWENAALSALERTLDDSANRRVFMPEAFLALDECLIQSIKVIEGLKINRKYIQTTLNQYGPFAATEKVLAELAKKGMDRQEAHELLRKHSLKAWDVIQEGKENPLFSMLVKDSRITRLLKERELQKLFDVSNHVGFAVEKSGAMAKKIAEATKDYRLQNVSEQGF